MTFKIGSVYRNQTGALVRILGAHPGAPGAVQVGFAQFPEDEPLFSAFRLSDGRCITGGCDADPEDPLHLVHPEHVKKDGQWLPLESPEIDPRFAAAHYQDGRDLKAEEERPSKEATDADHDDHTLRMIEEADAAERIRPALTWNTPTPFDPFADFHVRSNHVWQQGEEAADHPSPFGKFVSPDCGGSFSHLLGSGR